MTKKFAGVVIPTVTMPDRRQSTQSLSAPSTIADSKESSDLEITPDTSVAVTPAATSAKTKTSSASQYRQVNASARAKELKASAHSLHARSLSKRRRIGDSDDDEEDLDAAVARRLQAEEWGAADNGSSSKRRKANTSQVIDDTDSEDEIPLAIRRRLTIVKKETASDSELSEPDSGILDEVDAESDFDEDDLLESSAASSAELIEAVEETSVVQPVSSSRQTALQRRRNRRAAREAGLYMDPQKRRAVRERKKLEKAHPEIITMWESLKEQPIIKPDQAEQPAGINRKLKSFQLEGLNWMIRQEQTSWRCGLLGDEMGMGKTIQAVSLIMSDFPARAPCLVVVPPVALMQWQAEINDYTNGKLKVLVYHISANPKCKLLTPKDLQKYNVIMVSYSGLESMYRKESKGWNRQDGIVKEDSILHSIKYHRVILDEAHSIKSRTTSVAKACFALKADYKWCLSGTPVQNRIGEFFSLLRFLEVVPFACYFCKSCRCKELHWSQDANKMCTGCKHSGFNHVSVFNQEILNPITQSESPEQRKQGLDKLRLITDRLMLRRMKKDHTSSMELPPKEVVIHNEFFGEIERDFSQSIMSNTQRTFDTYVNRGVMLNNYANIFGLIMQMRQVANHPDLILRKNAEGGQNVLICSICDEPAEEAIRSRCRHEFCRHCARGYVRSFEGAGGDADCPRCHIPLVIDWDQPDIEQDEENVKKSSIINRIKMEDWTSSTKIEMLVYDLWKLRSKKQTVKSIVFSQFTSMLQLVQWRLQKSGFSTVMLDGSMSPAQRQKSIEHFMNNVDVEVFLVSLKAGGVALNLTEASRVFIIDP